MLIVALSPSHFTRIVWTVLFCVATLGEHSYELITSNYLTFADFARLVRLSAFAGDVWGTYERSLLIAAGKTLVGILAIALPPCHGGSVPRWRIVRWAGLVPVIPVLLICSILYGRGGEGSDGLPVQYNPLAFATFLSYAWMTEEPLPERSAVELPYTGRRELKDVVVIIDASVGGDYLDINSPTGVRTSLDLFSSEVVNFGIASASANCSAAANITLRYPST